MKKLALLLFFLVLFGNALLSIAQDRQIEITGEIMNIETQEAVPYVHVINKTDSIGTVSNTEGRFWIKMHPTDTLLFSAIGFETLVFSLKDEVTTDKLIVTIEMNTSTLELQPVKVFAFRDEAALKRALVETQVPLETNTRGIQLPGFYYGPKKEVKPTLGNPISFVASKFSREVKERKKLQEYKERESYYNTIKDKYNKDVVVEITKLPEDKVEEFMEFCQIPDSFIHRATQYELVVAISQCLTDFEKLDEK